MTQGPILVTGATGNVGSAVVRALSARGVPFRVGVRSVEEAKRTFRGELGELDATLLDLEKPDTYDAAVRGTRGLFLLRPPPLADVKPTLNVLIDRFAAQGGEHVVFLSVSGAEKNSWVPHAKVEKHLLAHPVAHTILRAGFFAQNLGDQYREDIRHGEIVLPSGHGRVAFVDVRDLGECAVGAFGDPAARGAAWTLTGPEAVTFDEIAALLTRLLARTVRYRPVGIARYAAHLRRAGLPWGRIAIQTILHTGIRRGDAERVDPTLGERLGRTPGTVEAYVRDHLALWAS